MTKVGIGSIYKEIDKAWVGIGGVWKEVEKMWSGIGGVWKEVEGLNTVRLFISYRNKWDDSSYDKKASELNPITLAVIRTSGNGYLYDGLGSIDKMLCSLWTNSPVYTSLNSETFAVINLSTSISGTLSRYEKACDISSNDDYIYLSYYQYWYDEYDGYYAIVIERRNKTTWAVLSRISINMSGFSSAELVGGSGNELYGGTSRGVTDKIYERNPTTLAEIRTSTSAIFTTKTEMSGLDSTNSTIYVSGVDRLNTPYKSYIVEVNKTTLTRTRQVQTTGIDFIHGITTLK